MPIIPQTISINLSVAPKRRDRAAGGCRQATLKKRYWIYGLLL
ncbi:hypothetical protein [Coleofasciculus sp. FACHB-1120]|nr:hypothetical protein [Coleofasciculus sp. FACHB-1120]